MKKNIGTTDRVMRLICGIVLLVLAFVVVKILAVKIILVTIALFCFYQALMSWCLWYQIIGKNTCPVE